MKKLIWPLLALGLLVLLVGFSTPAQAHPPGNASGIWLYTPYLLEQHEAGCKTIFKTMEEGVWSGTFVGTSTEYGRVRIECDGEWLFKAVALFDHVEIDGKSGQLKMLVWGSRPDATAEWFGYWVIKAGTGGLTNLRGEGTFWGPGAPGAGEQGTIYYDGNVHFEHAE